MTTRIRPKTHPAHAARKAPQQVRSRQTRLDLLGGATRVLRDLGASGLTTNRIAEKAGVSVGSLYQYYPNKAALLADLHAEEGARLWHELAPVLRDTQKPPSVRLLCVLEGVFVAQARASEQHKALAAAGVDPLESAELAELGAAFQRDLGDLLAREAGRSGEAAASDAAFCLRAVLGLLVQLAKGPPDEAEARLLAERTTDMLSAYLRLPDR